MKVTGATALVAVDLVQHACMSLLCFLVIVPLPRHLWPAFLLPRETFAAVPAISYGDEE